MLLEHVKAIEGDVGWPFLGSASMSFEHFLSVSSLDCIVPKR